MRFESFASFVQMDGHGLYIWMAYAITLIVITANLWWPAVVKQRFIRGEKQAYLRQQAAGSGGRDKIQEETA